MRPVYTEYEVPLRYVRCVRIYLRTYITVGIIVSGEGLLLPWPQLTHPLPAPAVAQVEQKVEGRVDGDEEMVHAHQDWEPLQEKSGKLFTCAIFRHCYKMITIIEFKKSVGVPICVKQIPRYQIHTNNFYP